MSLRREIVDDLERFDAPPWKILLREPQHRWLVLYRLADHARGPLRGLLELAARRYGRRLGFSVPLGTLGSALRLPHYGLLVVNGAARIGRNCQVCHGTTLGGTADGAPLIGDNVFIGPNVTVIGPVVVGEGAILMAGANIRSDVLPGARCGPADDAHKRPKER